MKKNLSFIFFVCLFTSLISQAEKKFGAGIVLGEPTGFTVKYLLGNQNAIDGALSFLGSNSLYLHSTYLKLMPRAFNIDKQQVNWYYGLGGRLLNHEYYHWHEGKYYDARGSHTHIGVRAPVGLNLLFASSSVEAFGELSLTMDIVPLTSMYINLALGGRYYF